MNLVAIIPARGGSKRVPRKNLQSLGGVPLLAWAVSAARRAVGEGNVWCSSEDEEILDVANRWGANPLRRPADLSEDHIADFPVFRHAWATIHRPGTLAVWLKPTAPLVDHAEIHHAAILLEETPWADSVRTIRPVREHPGKMIRVLAHEMAGRWVLSPFLPGQTGAVSSGRLEPVWIGSGQFRIVRPERVIASGSLSGDVCLGWTTLGLRAVDIDTLEDFAVVERRIKELGLPIPEPPE